MVKDLIKMANHLDKLGLKKEADYIDGMIRKNAAGVNITLNSENLYGLRMKGMLPKMLQGMSNEEFDQLIESLKEFESEQERETRLKRQKDNEDYFDMIYSHRR